MIRLIGLILALAAGTAAAGEMDCYNDDIDDAMRYTRAEPDEKPLLSSLGAPTIRSS